MASMPFVDDVEQYFHTIKSILNWKKQCSDDMMLGYFHTIKSILNATFFVFYYVFF